ncbi:hypothetical protein TWF694_000486 [Orbilia ellipsospora]|uniref:Uncharacterized protein n=1 Tax=Orbilia ellipsospora TaxID=2528407 RepID=A0AAV9XVD9_9PEZI
MRSFTGSSRSIASSLLLLATLLPSTVRSEVIFSNPVAGKTFTGGSAIPVAWADDGNTPVSTSANTFSIDLCTGSNANVFRLLTLVATDTFGVAAGSLTPVIPSTIGASGDVYFLRMEWISTAGTVVNWSDRFGLTGMTGVFTADMTAANAVGDVDRPPAIHPFVPPDPNLHGSDFAIPYAQQTGPIKYAPMQPRPGTVITAKNMKPLNPTSAYTIFTTKGGPPNVQTTITQAATYQLTTVINEAAPAPMPDDAMQRFLNRWKD